jgi:hypothetical protein
VGKCCTVTSEWDWHVRWACRKVDYENLKCKTNFLIVDKDEKFGYFSVNTYYYLGLS